MDGEKSGLSISLWGRRGLTNTFVYETTADTVSMGHPSNKTSDDYTNQ